MASPGPSPAAAVTIPLELPHTRCSRCSVWSRRPDRCPHCGAAKSVAAGGGYNSLERPGAAAPGPTAET
jgi:hypothetical protein